MRVWIPFLSLSLSLAPMYYCFEIWDSELAKITTGHDPAIRTSKRTEMQKKERAR